MIDQTPAPGSDPGLLREKLLDCRSDATLLLGLLEGLGALDNEGRSANAVSAMIEIAIDRARTGRRP